MLGELGMWTYMWSAGFYRECSCLGAPCLGTRSWKSQSWLFLHPCPHQTLLDDSESWLLSENQLHRIDPTFSNRDLGWEEYRPEPHPGAEELVLCSPYVRKNVHHWQCGLVCYCSKPKCYKYPLTQQFLLHVCVLENIYSPEGHREAHSRISSAALCVLLKNWKQFNFPSIRNIQNNVNLHYVKPHSNEKEWVRTAALTSFTPE